MRRQKGKNGTNADTLSHQSFSVLFDIIFHLNIVTEKAGKKKGKLNSDKCPCWQPCQTSLLDDFYNFNLPNEMPLFLK